MDWRVIVGASLLVIPGCFDAPDSALDTEGETSSGSGTSPASTDGGPGPDDDPTGADDDPTGADDDPTGADDDPDGTADSPTDADATAEETGPVPDCEGMGPVAECPAEAPFCAGGTCVDCSGLPPEACTGLDAATPVCDAGVCVGCWEHDQCASGACRIATGECFAEDNRLWVAPGGDCALADGSEAMPFCNIVNAVTVVNDQSGSDPWAIFVAGSPNPYSGTITPYEHPLAIIGPSSGLDAETSATMGYAVDLWNGPSEVYLAQLSIEGSFSGATIRGTSSAGASLYLHDVTINGGDPAIDSNSLTINLFRTEILNYNFAFVLDSGGTLNAFDSSIHDGQGAIVPLQGTAHIERSLVFNSYTAGGIDLDGGSLTLVNSAMWSHSYANDGIAARNGGTFDLLYSTVVGEVSCVGAGPSTIRNSIVLGHSYEAGQTCTSAAVDNSVVNLGVGQGSGNVFADDTYLASIFVDSGFMTPDYHVLEDSTPAGVAVWEDGDPTTDVDGDARPSVAGTADYAGFDAIP